jgi:hypothetical protein
MATTPDFETSSVTTFSAVSGSLAFANILNKNFQQIKGPILTNHALYHASTHPTSDRVVHLNSSAANAKRIGKERGHGVFHFLVQIMKRARNEDKKITK